MTDEKLVFEPFNKGTQFKTKFNLPVPAEKPVLNKDLEALRVKAFEEVTYEEFKDLFYYIDDLIEVQEDKKRLTRELDVALHGEEGAAKQASLCDLIGPAQDMREQLAAYKAEADMRMSPNFESRLRLRQTIERKNIQLSEAHGFLREFLDVHGVSCRLDHNGNCQEHFVTNPCLIADVRKLLEKEI